MMSQDFSNENTVDHLAFQYFLLRPIRIGKIDEIQTERETRYILKLFSESLIFNFVLRQFLVFDCPKKVKLTFVDSL